MADLTVTIQETGTALQGSQSISESKTLTIEGITSYYHFKGQAEGSGSNKPMYAHNTTGDPTGAGGDKQKLAYLRITNLDSDSTLRMAIETSGGGSYAYFRLLSNESFIWCPDIGNSSSDQFYHRTDGDTVSASGYITKIFLNVSYNENYYEVFGAFID